VRVGGRTILPSGSYVEGGKAFSSTGKPLTGAAAKGVLAKASAGAAETGATTTSVAASRFAGVGKVLRVAGPALAIAGESYRGYEEYSTEAENIAQAQEAGQLSALEAAQEKSKAKGRAVGKTAVRAGSGLLGAALTSAAVGAGIGAVGGAGIGAVPGFLIGLGAGVGGYYLGQYAAEKTGAEQLGSDIGEGTSELLFSPPSEGEKPILQTPESKESNIIDNWQKGSQRMENKSDQTKEIQERGFGTMLMGIEGMISKLDQIKEVLLMSSGGNVASNVNILGGGGSGDSESITTVSRIDPTLYNRSLYYNTVIGPRGLA
jgi:hypothetical protein